MSSDLAQVESKACLRRAVDKRADDHIDKNDGRPGEIDENPLGLVSVPTAADGAQVGICLASNRA